MPKPKEFVTRTAFYSTLFHELVHSTGHESRLDRDSLCALAAFGSYTYSKEELVAEIGANFLRAEAGFDTEEEVKRLCAFLEVDFELELLDVSNYLDGDNKPWKQNTNYDYKTKPFINVDSLHRWQTVLERSDLLLIELITRDWMEKYSYKTQYSPAELIEADTGDFRRWHTAGLSEWIRPFSFDEDEAVFEGEIIKEKLRLHFLYSNGCATDKDHFALQMSHSD